MGIMDAFGKEDRIEITVNQLYQLVKEAERADMFRNGVKNQIPYSHILCVLDGEDSTLKVSVWHDAKSDPPKTPGLYYGKKDDTNSMYLCNYRDGVWTLSETATLRGPEIGIVKWAEYTAFHEEG